MTGYDPDKPKLRSILRYMKETIDELTSPYFTEEVKEKIKKEILKDDKDRKTL